ncbi:hypothetical protein BIW11_12788 [Tropilaelaps mercedesae]|uniref:Uncharacterized protein n=1 Tax=Tropilaelaps mercedesae TaxID=418985 RepID=A0A1V9X4W6_9ACAR|nr:hypothetical protein BIW11_12788 [Tropilaelaps mercedesae]
MSYRSYGSSYGSPFRRPYTSLLSSASYSSTLSPVFYRPSTYSSNFSALSSTYRQPPYGSLVALSNSTSSRGSSEDLLANTCSSGSSRPLPRCGLDSPPVVQKASFTRSFGNLDTLDTNDECGSGLRRSSKHQAAEINYKKLYEEELCQRKSDEAALVAELGEQIRLRDTLINLLSELETLEDDLDDTIELRTLLEVYCDPLSFPHAMAISLTWDIVLEADDNQNCYWKTNTQ